MLFSAEHIGLVSAFLVKNYRFQFQNQFKNECDWIHYPLIKKIHLAKKGLIYREDIVLNNDFAEITIYPVGIWLFSENERMNDKSLSNKNSVEYARNLASFIAYCNENSKDSINSADGAFHETLSTVKKQNQRTRDFEHRLFDRGKGKYFRENAAWMAEYYLDRHPSIKPIELCKLILNIKRNLSCEDYAFLSPTESINEIRENFNKLIPLLDEAIIDALSHSNFFTKSPDTWIDEKLYNDMMKY